MHINNLCFTKISLQSLEPDLNYASLDLKVTNKPKKKHRRNHPQGCKNVQEQVAVGLSPPMNAFLEVDINVDAQLPPIDQSSMISHSSIYLNTQQIAKETEDMAREQSVYMEEKGSDWITRDQDWEEGEKRRDSRDRNICTEAQDCHSDTDHFSNSSWGI